MGIVSAVTGLMKTFFFLFPFVMELFLGKAPNPYSRNPKDWRAGEPAHPWIRRLAIIVGILSLVFNYYLVTRLITVANENIKLKKEIVELKRPVTGPVSSVPPNVPDITPPATTQDVTPTLDVTTPLSTVPTVTYDPDPEVKPTVPPKAPVKPPRRKNKGAPPRNTVAEDQRAHKELMDRLEEIEKIGRE